MGTKWARALCRRCRAEDGGFRAGGSVEELGRSATPLFQEVVGTEAAVAALADSLARQTNLGITITARELGKLKARSAIPALANCLQTRKDELGVGEKLLVIRALIAMPHRSEVPALAAVLNDRNRRVRRAAARALKHLDMPEADAALQDAARRPSWPNARPARQALSRKSSPADKARMKKSWSERAYDALDRIMELILKVLFS